MKRSADMDTMQVIFFVCISKHDGDYLCLLSYKCLYMPEGPLPGQRCAGLHVKARICAN